MPNRADARTQRFDAYVERLATALGHRDRHEPVRAYVTGLCLPGDRKSIEPMAARVDPRHVRARHQSMHHFVANAPWDDAAVLRVARTSVLAALERQGPADAGYGVITAFRDQLTARGVPYAVGISSETTVWAPGRAPLPPRTYRGHGRPSSLMRRTARHRPLSVQALAQQLPTRAWYTVTW